MNMNSNEAATKQIVVADAILLREMLGEEQARTAHWKNRTLVLAQTLADMEATLEQRVTEAVAAAVEAKLVEAKPKAKAA